MTTGNIADYAGRSVDISLFQGVNAELFNPVTAALADEDHGGAIVTGIVKLSQRFFLEFMTEAGSIPSAPERGSDFMFEARTGGLRTTADAEQEFYMSLDQIKDNLVGEEDEDTPDDESFATATLINVSLTGGELKLHVAVISLAGESIEVILPVFTRN